MTVDAGVLIDVVFDGALDLSATIVVDANYLRVVDATDKGGAQVHGAGYANVCANVCVKDNAERAYQLSL